MNLEIIRRLINSDIDTPLNELINTKKYGTQYENKTPNAFEVVTTNDDWTTVVDIIGSGLASISIISTGGNSFASVKITVDGTIINEQSTASLADERGRIYGVANSGHAHSMMGNWGLSLANNPILYEAIPKNIPLECNSYIGFNNGIKYEIKRAEGGLNVKGKVVVLA